MSPGSSHGLGHFLRIQVSKDLLNAAQFSDCIDFVCSQRVD